MITRADAVRPQRMGTIGRVFLALGGMLTATLAFSQAGPGYATGENPFQKDYDFALGKPVTLRVDIEGVRLDTITVVAPGEPKSGTKLKCEISVEGSSETNRKATVTGVLLFENAKDKGMERVTLDQFKVKPGKSFEEKQKLPIEGDTLLAAAKIYVFFQVAF